MQYASIGLFALHFFFIGYLFRMHRMGHETIGINGKAMARVIFLVQTQIREVICVPFKNVHLAIAPFSDRD